MASNSTPDSEESSESALNIRDGEIVSDAVLNSQKEVVEYKCPFCDYRSKSERAVIRHIVDVTSGKHKNRNPNLEPINIHMIAEDGSVVDHQNYGPLDQTGFEGQVSTQLLPEGVDEETRAAEILEVALKNPSLGPLDIAERVYGNRDKNPYIYRVLQKYLQHSPAEAENTSSSSPPRSFEDLTPKRQRIIEAYLREVVENETDPADVNIASIGRRIKDDVSDSYPYTVVTNESELIDHLRAKLEAGTISFPLRSTEGQPEGTMTTDGTRPQTGVTRTAQTEGEYIQVPRADLYKLEQKVSALRGYADAKPETDGEQYILSVITDFLQTISAENAETATGEGGA